MGNIGQIATALNPSEDSALFSGHRWVFLECTLKSGRKSQCSALLVKYHDQHLEFD